MSTVCLQSHSPGNFALMELISSVTILAGWSPPPRYVSLLTVVTRPHFIFFVGASELSGSPSSPSPSSLSPASSSSSEEAS